MLRSQLLQQIVGTILIRHVHAVADALGVSFVDCETNVTAEALVSNKSRGNFSRMKRDANFGIEPVQEIHHAHVQRVIGHRIVAIFRHHEIYAGDARINRRDFEPEQGLREYLLFRKAAKHLIKEADFHVATWRSIGLTAMLAFISKLLGAIPMSAGDGDVIAQTVIEQRLAKFGEIILPAEVVCNLDRVNEGRRVHQFEVLLVLCGGTGGNFVEPRAGVARIDDLEFRKRVEEMIVTARTGGRNERAHRERVYERIVEMLILKSA